MSSGRGKLYRPVSIEDLPVVRHHGPTGHRGDLTAAERALLQAMKPRLLELLGGNGLTVSWLSEQTGLGSMQCTTYLRELGGHYIGWKNRWMFPKSYGLKRSPWDAN